MRGPRKVARSVIGAAVAGTLVATVAMTSAGDSVAAADEAISNTTNEDLAFTNDVGGCGIALIWELCVYSQHGLDSVARVVADGSESTRGDGSLRMATPGEDDRVLLEHGHVSRSQGAPRLANFRSGEYSLHVLRGEGPSYTLWVDCPAGTAAVGEYQFRMTYAGPMPEQGAGWQKVDVVQDGRALWSGGGFENPRPLDVIKATCPDGEVESHGLSLASPGSESRVDSLRFNAETTNFWIPWLARVTGQHNLNRTPIAAAQRVRAGDMAQRQFTPHGDYNGYSAGWVNPARRRVPAPKAVVIANQFSFKAAMIAGPLANAVGGPLLLNSAGPLRRETEFALRGEYPSSKRVYLVGNRKQLSPELAGAVRDLGLEVVRIGGRDPWTMSVNVARIVDRRRPAGIKRTLVLASAKGDTDTLAAAPAAGTRRGAVLLTDGTRMPPVTKEYLASHRPAAVYAVGRAASKASHGLSDDHKIVGATASSTVVKVAKRFFPHPRSAVFASVSEDADAFIAGAYGGHMRTPVLLIKRDTVPAVVSDYIRAQRGELLGSLLVGDNPEVSSPTFGALLRRLTPR